MNRGSHAGFIADDARGVTFARQVFCEIHMTGTIAVQAPIGEANLHFALQCDDELSPRGGVPVAKTAGLRTSKDDTFRGQE
jgi:hypothetical protein